MDVQVDLHSKIEFEGFDYKKAMCYLRIVAGEDILRSSGLSRLIPKWQGDRVEALRVTGLSGKNMNNWTHPNHIPTIFERKLILELVMEVGILIAIHLVTYLVRKHI